MECGERGRYATTLLCDGCNGAYHIECVGLEGVPRGPWHCDQCKALFLRAGVTDLTLDTYLMSFVYEGVHLEGATDETRRRVEKAANMLGVDH